MMRIVLQSLGLLLLGAAALLTRTSDDRDALSAPPSPTISPPAAESPAVSQERIRTVVTRGGRLTLPLPSGRESYLILSRLDPGESHDEIRVRLRPRADRDARVEVLALSDLVPLPAQPVPPAAAPPEVALVTAELTAASRSLAGLDGPVSETSAPRRFHLHVTDGALDDPRQYASVRAVPLAEGTRVRVLRDRQRAASPGLQRLAAAIVEELDAAIIPACDALFGPSADVDGDGKLTVLLTPWLDRLQGGRTSVKGFVRGSDFQAALPPPLGNRADVIYLNSELAAGENLRTLLAHEYLHVLSFSLRECRPDGPLPTEEDWLNEAEAHLAENLLGGDGSNLEHRLQAFLETPENAPLVVSDYYSCGRWRDDGCRGATYLFLRWCADHSDTGFLQRLLTSPETGRANVAAATGLPFDQLYLHWTLALLAAGEDLPAPAPFAFFDAESPFAEGILRRLTIQRLDGGQSAHSVGLAGTSSVYFRVNVPEGMRLEIDRPDSGRLQVTVVPVPVPTEMHAVAD